MDKKDKEIDLTPEEFDKIKKALKDETFRKLLHEYAEEISDPENRKKREEEIAMLEKGRGMDVKFVKPQDNMTSVAGLRITIYQDQQIHTKSGPRPTRI